MPGSSRRLFALAILTLLAAAPASEPASKPAARPSTLHDPAKKEIAMKLVSAAENSSLDWRAQYKYLEYNVEHNDKENRGYTGGIIGFTSRTHDMLDLVRYYRQIAPNNKLNRFIKVLAAVDGTPSRDGLGRPFERAWKQSDADPKFREAQDHERDRVYFDPAVDKAIGDGLHELGQFCYYDAIVMHGPGDDDSSFGGIRNAALRKAKRPADGGDETAYLNAFMDARVAAMKKEEAHSDTSRVDTLQRVFLKAGNLTLKPPLVFKTYGDLYRIEN